MHALLTAEDAARFALAGRAILTLTSRRSGASYTFRWKQSDRSTDDYFVSLLTGPHNTMDYTYLGMFRQQLEAPFILTKKSKMLITSMPVIATRFFVERVIRGKTMPAGLEVRHEGKCGRCTRTLTVPESIDRGIGPECAAQMGLI